MFKRILIDKKFALKHIVQYPHSDSRILHAPSECLVCDMHPEWQALRIAWGIAFTGYEPEDKELPDPATHARGPNVDKLWTGNQPWYKGYTDPSKGQNSADPSSQAPDPKSE